MARFLYPIRKLKVKPWIKYWLIKRTAGVLSEVMENLTSPITLTDSLRRKFKIFQIGGNSVQDGEPSPTNEVPIQNVTGNVDVKVENKNWALNDDPENPDANYKSSGGGTTVVQYSNTENGYYTETHRRRSFGILKAGTYTISVVAKFKQQSTYAIISSIGGNTNIIVPVSSLTNNYKRFSFTFTITEDEEFIATFYKSLYWKDIQLEEDSATSYEPHEEQTVTFPLSEGQILHETDTIEDKIVQRRKTVSFDGTETWTANGSYNNQYYRYISSLSDRKNNGAGLSNYFSVINNINSVGLYNGVGANFIVEGIETVSDWKAWLAEKYANGTPVTLEYELAEPIEIPFTEAQRQAKAQIDKLYSYKGTTYISSDNEPSPTFTIQYVEEEE